MIETVLGWLPAIVVVLSTLGGGALYTYQKSIDRHLSLIQLRREFYGEFLESWSRVYLSKSPDAQEKARYGAMRLRLFTVASDDVVREFGQLNLALNRAHAAQPGAGLAGDEFEVTRERLARLMSAIRADCFERSDLPMSDVEQLLPLSPESRPPA